MQRVNELEEGKFEWSDELVNAVVELDLREKYELRDKVRYVFHGK